MKTKHLFQTLLVIAAVQCTSILHAQTWEPADQPTGSTVSAVATAADGTVYSLVRALQPDGSSLKYVRLSIDGGISWMTVGDAFAAPASKLVVDAANHLYLAGVNATGDYWNVLKSEDGGQTWTPLYVGNSLPFWELYDIAVDSGGAVYVVGSSFVSGAGSQQVWTVRKGSLANVVWSWSTVDSFALTSRTGSGARTIAIKPAGLAGQPEQIYVGGHAYPKSGDAQWVVRRSVGGATWTTVDASSSAIQCSGLTVSPGDGSVFAVGYAIQAATRKTPATTYTVVRKGSFDVTAVNAIRWTEQTRFINPYAVASITADTFGRVFMGGSGDGPSGAPFGWRIWASSNGNAPYNLTDALDGGTVFSMTVDSYGNVIAGGRRNNSALVRRLPAQ